MDSGTQAGIQVAVGDLVSILTTSLTQKQPLVFKIWITSSAEVMGSGFYRAKLGAKPDDIT